METKDLHYASAEYTREHQRTYTVLDIAEGDSNLVVLSPAMQYSDAVRAYDITTVESTVVTDAVSKWILTGESIWQVLEHLRLDIHTVDNQRIALPEGFIGRVLIARVTPDANVEASELIRLGALLHRIQQEPTAAVVYKHKVKPVTPVKPFVWLPDMDLGLLNTEVFQPVRFVMLPHDLEHHFEPIYDSQLGAWKWTDDRLRMFWRDYERSQELMQELSVFMSTFPYSAKVSNRYFVDLNTTAGLALQTRHAMRYCYPQDYWVDWNEPSEGFLRNVQVKEVSLNDIEKLPTRTSELTAYMGSAVYLRVPLGEFRGQQYYVFLARGAHYKSYVGTHFADVFSITYNKATTRDYKDIYHVAGMDSITTGSETSPDRVLSDYSSIRVRTYRWAQVKQSVFYTSEKPFYSGGLNGRISALAFASHNDIHTPQDALSLIDTPAAPIPSMYEDDPRYGSTLIHTQNYLVEGSDVVYKEIYPRYGVAPYVEVVYLDNPDYWTSPATNEQYRGGVPGYITDITPSPDDVLKTMGITADTATYPQGVRNTHAVPWSSTGFATPNRERYRITAFTPTDVWRISYFYAYSRNLWHLKGIYEKWQQLRKASEHSTSDSLSSS